MDQILNLVLGEFIFCIILMIAEKYIENYTIKDVQQINLIVFKYVEKLKPHFTKFATKWKKRDCNKLRNKMIASTLEDIYKYKNDKDYQDVFRMLNYILQKNIHHDIFKDLGEKVDKCAKFKINIKKHTFKVYHK